MEDQTVNDLFLDHMQSSDFAATTEPGSERRTIPIIGKILLVIQVMCICILLISASISINSYLKAFHAPIIEVDSVVVYPFNISSSSRSITLNWSISISIANSEYGTSYCYKDLEAAILMKNEEICWKNIGDLNLNGVSRKMMKKKTVRIENMKGDWVYVHKTTVDAVRSEWRKDGTLTFTLKINGRGKKGSEEDDNKWKKIVASCDDLKVEFIYNTGVATLLTPSFMCSVDIYD